MEQTSLLRSTPFITAVLAGTLMALFAFVAVADAKPGNTPAPQQSGKFTLDGTATIEQDPEGVRPVNHVVRIDTSDDELAGSAGRPLDTQADDLDGALSLDYYIESGDCGGGSPRISLSVDNDGDGVHDGWLHGHVDPQSTGCPAAAGAWDSADLTDGVARWETAQLGLGLPFVVSWSDVEANLDPDHTILFGMLVDDSWWKASAAGVAYYDNVEIGDSTLSGNQDVLGSR